MLTLLAISCSNRCSTQNSISNKTIFQERDEIKTCSGKRKLRICCKKPALKNVIGSLNIREITLDRNKEHQKGRKNNIKCKYLGK